MPRKRQSNTGKLVSLIISISAVAAFACGGGDKAKKDTTTTTTTGDGNGTGEKEDPPLVEITEDKLTEIKSMLKRKRDSVTKCFGEAMKAKELTKNDRGSITVLFTISTDGKAINARVGETTIKSETLNKCVLIRLRRWEFPTLPKELQYSYRFGFASF